MAAYSRRLSVAARLFTFNSPFVAALPRFRRRDAALLLTASPSMVCRLSSYDSSPKAEPLDQYPAYETSSSPEEWKYVERLLPLKVVPEPQPKEKYPSGWRPQSEDCFKYPYYVGRTKNHMVPVYLDITFRGQRRVTVIKRIQGDIWALEKELKEYLEEKEGKRIASQVHEMCSHIYFKGDYVTFCEQWLLNKGF